MRSYLNIGIMLLILQEVCGELQKSRFAQSSPPPFISVNDRFLNRLIFLIIGSMIAGAVTGVAIAAGATTMYRKFCGKKKKALPSSFRGLKKDAEHQNKASDSEDSSEKSFQYVSSASDAEQEERRLRREATQKFLEKAKAKEESRKKRNKNKTVTVPTKSIAALTSTADLKKNPEVPPCETKKTSVADKTKEIPRRNSLPVVTKTSIPSETPLMSRQQPRAGMVHRSIQKQSDDFRLYSRRQSSAKACYDTIFFRLRDLGKMLNAEKLFPSHPIIKELAALYHLNLSTLARRTLHRQLTNSGEKSRETDAEVLTAIRNVIMHAGTELKSKMAWDSIREFAAVAAQEFQNLRLPPEFPIDRARAEIIKELYKDHTNWLASLDQMPLTRLRQPVTNNIRPDICRNWLVETMVPLINCLAAQAIEARKTSEKEKMIHDALKMLFSWCGEYQGFLRGPAEMVTFMHNCHEHFRNLVGHEADGNISSEVIQAFCQQAASITTASRNMTSIDRLGIRDPDAQVKYQEPSRELAPSPAKAGVFAERKVPSIFDIKLPEHFSDASQNYFYHPYLYYLYYVDASGNYYYCPENYFYQENYSGVNPNP